MKTTKKAIVLIILSSLCAGTGQLFWKHASFSLGFNVASLFNIYFIIGCFLYFLATVFMTLSFREGELSVLHPILATGYIWLILISPIFIPTETLSLQQILGALFIFAGVCFISAGRAKR